MSPTEPALVARARGLAAGGQWASATELLEKWVAAHPADPDALVLLSDTLVLSGADVAESLQPLERAAALNSDDPVVTGIRAAMVSRYPRGLDLLLTTKAGPLAFMLFIGWFWADVHPATTGSRAMLAAAAASLVLAVVAARHDRLSPRPAALAVPGLAVGIAGDVVVGVTACLLTVGNGGLPGAGIAFGMATIGLCVLAGCASRWAIRRALNR